MAHQRFISHINRKKWWHVPPRDPEAYRKRGKFYSSSFAEAEFWGRPLDQPERVNICSPLVGDEDTIERKLFGRVVSRGDWPENRMLEKRFALDAKMKQEALKKGFDAIVLMSPKGFSGYRESGKLPRSMELNVLRWPRIPQIH